MPLISLRAYSRHRGVSLKAVQKAIDAGRITLIGDKIDPAVADIQWAQNTRPDQQERGSLKDFEKTQADLAQQTKPSTPADASKDSGGSGLSGQKAETEQVKRQLMELQLAQKLGTLVNVADFERALASKLKAASDAFSNLADRLAPVLAAETDVNVVDRVLREEHRRILSDIAQEAPAAQQ